jgi:hypothetical protein
LPGDEENDMARSDFVAFKASEALRRKLDELGRVAGGKSRSAILRFLVAAAKPEDLPRAWTEIAPEEQQLIAIAERLEVEG